MRKKKQRSAGRKKLPVSIALPVAAPVVETGQMVAKKGADSGNDIVYIWTGFDGQRKFHWDRAVKTYAPMVGGIVVHKTVGRYVNKYLPKWLPINL